MEEVTLFFQVIFDIEATSSESNEYVNNKELMVLAQFFSYFKSFCFSYSLYTGSDLGRVKMWWRKTSWRLCISYSIGKTPNSKNVNAFGVEFGVLTILFRNLSWTVWSWLTWVLVRFVHVWALNNTDAKGLVNIYGNTGLGNSQQDRRLFWPSVRTGPPILLYKNGMMV